MTIKGSLVIASVAGLFASMTPLVASADKKGEEVKCDGVNACKGQGGCKSAKNDCAGKNGCKGQGFMKTSAKDCKAKGGTVEMAAK